jgi:hypothetical protein
MKTSLVIINPLVNLLTAVFAFSNHSFQWTLPWLVEMTILIEKFDFFVPVEPVEFLISAVV